MQVARQIADPARQAEALADAAEALAAQDSETAKRQARVAVAHALTGPSWFSAMPVLARLDPGAALSASTAMLTSTQP